MATQLIELIDECGNVDLCEAEPTPSTRIIRVIRRVTTAERQEVQNSGDYAAQYAYACGYHD
jgi:hypothetical protein